MPVEFLSDEQVAGYGRFVEEPSRRDLDRCCWLSDTDRVAVGDRRGDQNRLGFAVQLATVRLLGRLLADPVDVIDDALAEASPIDELLLRQERRSLQTELDSMTVEQTIEDVESAFVEVAKSYSERKGIEYLTWRDLGVSAEVLRRAGVKR